MDLEVLKVWPDWSATRLLGEGSYGKVYEIVRKGFGMEEHCALKVISIPSSEAELQSLKNEDMDDAAISEYLRGLVEEFAQEISLMAQLKGNANVVGYEDYAVIEHKGSVGWDILIRMELLTALPDYIKEHSFAANDVIKMAMDLCNALEVCHGRRIIHRDIKPDNIFVNSNGDYKLGDFGVARTVEKTVSGLSKKGTYTYMAPEVYRSEPYGTNADLYSLGIVMYKLLNHNREPFLPPHPEPVRYNDKNNALGRRMNGEIIPPPVNCNQYLARVVLKSICYRTGDRYQKPEQMKADLLAVKTSIESGSTPILQSSHINSSATRNTGSAVPNAFGGSATSPSHYTVPKEYSGSSSSGKPFFLNDSQSQATVTTPSDNYVKTENAVNTATNNPNQTLTPEQAKNENMKRKVISDSTVIGWLGVLAWSILLLFIRPKIALLSIGIAVCLLVLQGDTVYSNKRKTPAIVMLIFSILSINVLCIISAAKLLNIKD